MTWLAHRPRPSARVRLFCLPHSGGGASAFRDWPADLPGWIDVVPVTLPGRGERLTETPFESMTELAAAAGDALCPHFDRPFALFGHSMGALLAYEIALRQRRAGGPAPIALLVAGIAPPHRLPSSDLHTLPDEQFLDALDALGGIPDRLRREDDLLRSALPAMRADTTVVGTYRHRAGPRLDCPLVAFCGTDDPLGSPAAMPGWGELTSGPATVREVSGDHFFVSARRPELTRMITAELRRNLPAASRAPAAATTRAAPPSPRPSPGTLRPREPVAVVGIGCRFPGAAGPEEFWRLLVDGVDSVTAVPDERTRHPEVYGALPAATHPPRARHGGFLGDVSGFDAAFFGVSPREAEHLDPQQRLLLEVTWEALEDARVPPTSLAGSRTGVFIGQMGRDYWELQSRHGSLDLHSLTGGGLTAFTSGRVNFALDLRGPSLTLDSACSSSLAAVHMACQSLAYGDCDLALAGGVNLVLLPELAGVYEQVGLMSSVGRCRFGDASADGFVRSEGVGVVVLKPLAAARADGDRVYAVVLSGAGNNDGAAGGSLVAPAQEAQEALLRQALAGAQVSPADVGYVEAHGTGTATGDAVELSALARVFGDDRSPERPCLVGSVKTNIGHPEGAAGIAGFIKTALVLHHRLVPGNPLLEEPNPVLTKEDTPLRLPTEAVPWPEGTPPVAGVTSFGLSGTNVHLVLSGAEEYEAPTRPEPTPWPLLLPLSGRAAGALTALTHAYADRLDGADPADAARVCAAAARGRSHHRRRLAAVAHSGEDLAAVLRERAEDPVGRGGGKRIVFVFPGHGSQWPGMGRRLLDASPAFRQTIERCDAAIQAHAGWSLLDMLRTGAPDALERTPVIQPALWAVEVALAAHWRSWGIRPDAVIGHSFGEGAAAQTAGALSLDDAARLICARGEITARADGQGAMAVVALPATEAAGRHGLTTAAVNGPRSTVLSGDAEAVTELLAELEREGVRAGRVRINYASHSPHMDPLREPLRAALTDLRPAAADVPFRSTVTGELTPGERLDADYWADHLRSPVRFADAVAAEAAGATLFLEVSPHPVLLPAIRQVLAADRDGRHAVTASLDRNRPETTALAEALGDLYTHGVDIDWSVYHPRPGPVDELPTYPWQRRPAWFTRTESPVRAPSIRIDIQPDGQGWSVDIATSGDAAPPAPSPSPEPAQRPAEQPAGDPLDALAAELGEVLGLPADQIPRGRPLRAIGCDSLTATEIGDRLRRTRGVAIPAATLLGATLDDIAERLADDERPAD